MLWRKNGIGIPMILDKNQFCSVDLHTEYQMFDVEYKIYFSSKTFLFIFSPV